MLSPGIMLLCIIVIDVLTFNFQIVLGEMHFSLSSDK